MPKNDPLLNQLFRTARKDFVPLGSILELTPRCTLDCKMCYVHLTEEQMNGRKELTGDQWISIIDQAMENGTLFVLLTGGECLMHKDFKKIYLHLREKGAIVSINTNGTIMNDEWFDFFVKNPPARFKITLYGMSEDAYEKVTGRREFTRVRDNILKLKNAGFSVKLAVTVCKYNYEETLDIIRFATDNGLEYSIDMAMHQANENTGRDVNDYELSGEQIADMDRRIMLMRGKKLFVNEPVCELPARMDDSETHKRLRCGAGRQIFSVGWTGNMYPCLWIQNQPQNLLEKSFEEAWKECNRIVEEYTMPMECDGCRYVKACSPCAVQRADADDCRHCNPAICKGAIAKINAGVVKLRSHKPEEVENTEA